MCRQLLHFLKKNKLEFSAKQRKKDIKNITLLNTEIQGIRFLESF